MNSPEIDAGTEESNAQDLPKAMQRKKKPRHKKKKRARLDNDDDQKESSVKCEPTKPGRKRLRKLGYQKRVMAPMYFLPIFAQNFMFTRSVNLDCRLIDSVANQTSTSDEERLEQASLIGKTSLNIITTGSIPDVHLSTIVDPEPQIFVQPLLVLDMNGILCHRLRGNNPQNDILDMYRPPISSIAKTPIIPRTDLDDFLGFLDSHFCLAIWTSAKKKTATKLVKALIPTDIQSRLLFVWSQQHCNASSSTKIHNEIDSDSGDDEDIVFEKDLSKVWMEFPLWNSHNTLLMDDSPDKCTKWHENAIHPPPLNGRIAQHREGESIVDDAENQTKQRLFFDGLTDFWKQHVAKHVVNKNADGFDSPYVSFEATTMVQYLREHAVGHMGWE